MTKELILSQGKVALVDDEDYEWLNQWKWSTMASYKTFYAQRSKRNLFGKDVMIRLHREILGASKGMAVDHINGDGLDNRRSNLRLATARENFLNRQLNSNNTSGYKGVVWDKSTKKWATQIGVNGKTVYLGLFDSLEEAAIVYDKAAREHFGEFARLNFPEML